MGGTGGRAPLKIKVSDLWTVCVTCTAFGHEISINPFSMDISQIESATPFENRITHGEWRVHFP